MEYRLSNAYVCTYVRNFNRFRISSFFFSLRSFLINRKIDRSIEIFTTNDYYKRGMEGDGESGFDARKFQ